MSIEQLLELIEQHDAKFLDLRYTDTKGKQHHTTIPAHIAKKSPDDWLATGQAFDGSSIEGWKEIQESDMSLLPDINTAFKDPFYDEPTIAIHCNVIDSTTGQAYDRDPRAIARRSENYLKLTGIADTAYFGPEPEFFIFDGVEYATGISGSHYRIHSESGVWTNGTSLDGMNTGHRPALKGGYTLLPPVDSGQDLRSTCCLLLEAIGIPVEMHHPEVATGSQMEIGTKFNTLVTRADWTQIQKYIIRNVAHNFGKTATFMPKPILGDNGSGMHVHQSIWKNGTNIFAGSGYGDLSDIALYYIGGIIQHGKALNAITNPSTNSYKRLVPHYEAPTKLAYSARNRSASIRVPYTKSNKARRIEVRFPDPMANPYLAFAALLMAGLDGIQNKTHPGNAVDKNLYDLSPEESILVPTVATTLEEALESLKYDHEFMVKGGVFSEDWVQSYLDLKTQEVQKINMTPNPVEFEMYYSL